MAKFNLLIVIIGITSVLVSAEPPRFRQTKRLTKLGIQNDRNRFARQEQAPEVTYSPAPYSPAGVTPEIPFNLPTETEAPIAEPDRTYVPPNDTYLPPRSKPQETYGLPDQTYGPPDSEDILEADGLPTSDEQPAIEEPEDKVLPPPQSNLVSENLIQPRKKSKARSRSAQLRFRNISRRLRSALLPSNYNTMEILHTAPVRI